MAAPPMGSKVFISVDTDADYNINVSSSLITLKSAPTIGDLFSVTTYNDTADQNLTTIVYVGPEYIPIVTTFEASIITFVKKRLKFISKAAKTSPVINL